VFGDDETKKKRGKIIAIEFKEEKDRDPLDCGFMSLFGFMDANQGCKISPSTLLLEGKVKRVSVLVVIDSGASHNFISPQVVSILGIVVEQGKPIRVRLGDGHRVATGGKCRGMKVQLGEFLTEVHAYVLELGNLYMIFEVVWL